MSAIHRATGVAIDGRAILIEGAPGSGKSSLALALIDRAGGVPTSTETVLFDLLARAGTDDFRALSKLVR